jgi:hypothetical protein
MSALGQKQTCAVQEAMSALPPMRTKADSLDAFAVKSECRWPPPQPSVQTILMHARRCPSPVDLTVISRLPGLSVRRIAGSARLAHGCLPITQDREGHRRAAQAAAGPQRGDHPKAYSTHQMHFHLVPLAPRSMSAAFNNACRYPVEAANSPFRTASSAFALVNHPVWRRRWVGLALAERGSHRSSAWFVGYGASLALRRNAPAPAPVLLNRPRCWQLIQKCLHSAARPERFRDPPHRETWLRFVAICDTFHTALRKVSRPAPAPPQSLRNTSPINKPLVGCSGLP